MARPLSDTSYRRLMARALSDTAYRRWLTRLASRAHGLHRCGTPPFAGTK
jgi:hypothetical protein